MSGCSKISARARPLCTRAALVFLISFCPIGCTRGRAVAASDPVAQILAPDSGSKLRKGQTADVVIRVTGSPEVAWSLSLHGGESSPTALATGAGVVPGATVAQVNADTLLAGTSYNLTLAVTDDDRTATAVATITVPDPQYTLIPLEPGNLSHRGYHTLNVDASGNQVLYSSATGDPAPITVLYRQTGRRDVVLLQLGNTTGPKFSGDGVRLFYEGFFQQGGFTVSGLGYRELISGADRLLVGRPSYPVFTVDALGQRVAFQDTAQDRAKHYFLYDQSSNTARQLTTDPAAININSACTAMLGTTPLITADGSRVVIITSATFGIVPEDPAIGCRIFAYDVASRSLQQVATLPVSFRSVIPALSADGHWLSFPVIAPWGTGSRGIPALVDMQAGTVAAPLVDVRPYTSFDATVTGDGNGVIISTEADLDPRVGNADHNLDLFYYDLATQQFTQISETVLGIGRTPNKCPSYQPGVSRDGGVVVFSFNGLSGEGCNTDGWQRNEADGFAFTFVRAVRKRPGNNGPVFNAILDQHVLAGDTLTLDMAAHDPDSDPISFFAQEKGGLDVIPGSVITDHYDGTATFQWPTRPQDVGDHVLRVAAFDEGGGEVFHDFTISVMPAGPNTPVPTPTQIATPTAPCTGDCDVDGQVTVDELVTGVSIALGDASLSACMMADTDGNDQVTVDELVAGTRNALGGCS